MSESGQHKAVDMSSEAIDRRLRDVAQLYRLGMAIKNVTWLGKARDILASPPIKFPSPPQPQDCDTHEKTD